MRALIEQKRARRRSGPFSAEMQRRYMDQARQREHLYADWVRDSTAAPLPSRRPCAACGMVDLRPPGHNLCHRCANQFRGRVAKGYTDADLP